MIPAWTLAMMDSAAATPGFSPLDLGSKLIAWWAPPTPGDNVTLNGSAVASWTDEVGGYDLSQATAAKQPLYDASGFDGEACAEFDGTDDHLALVGVPSAFPTGADPGEVWASCRQDEVTTNTNIRAVFTYGDESASSRNLWRDVSGGANRGIFYVSATQATASVDLSGIHIMRGVATGTHVRLDIDGTAGTELARVPSTGTARVDMGTHAPNIVSRYWRGAVRQVLVTEPLTTEEAAALYDWLDGGA